MAHREPCRTIFITGTDTGVGKTLLTALLLAHLRENGHRAFALKPFCTGGRADAELFHALQDGDLSLEQINPFYFSEPLAPLVASQKHNRRTTLDQVLGHIQKVRQTISQNARKSVLLIEGAGGLFVPLGEGYTWADVIQKLRCDVLIVAANRLGTINHTLLTEKALQITRSQQLAIALSAQSHPEKRSPDMASNPKIIADLLPSIPIFQISFLGPKACYPSAVKKNAKKLQKTLARILACYKLTASCYSQADRHKKEKINL